MQFFIDSIGSRRPKQTLYPYGLLQRSTWDDYGYKTTFNCELHLSENEAVDLGAIKILRINQIGDNTPMPASPFQSIGQEYCSFGGTFEYYDTLFKCGPAIYREFLGSLRDVVYDSQVLDEFRDQEGFEVSLLRYTNAEGVIKDARKLFIAEEPQTPSPKYENLQFRFQTRIVKESQPVVISFDFRAAGALPHRVNALIGYNGSGKTRLLSNLAIAYTGYGYESKEAMLHKTFGKFIGPLPAFDRVIVISYSAFDTFVIPTPEVAAEGKIVVSSQTFGYSYCGLRVPLLRGSQINAHFRLKTPDEIEEEFNLTLARIRTLNHSDLLVAALKPILQDSSFRKVSLIPLVDSSSISSLTETFRELSSGHKIVLKIVLDLVAQMSGARQSLILLDEPETHLHPPLLASLIRSIRIVLEKMNGYAIVATHSPVVLQETPSRFVRVLQRVGDRNLVRESSIETFGEDIGLITEQVFNLDDSATDWHEVLSRLSRKLSLEEIENLFESRLGFGPRSYVMSLREELEGNGGSE